MKITMTLTEIKNMVKSNFGINTNFVLEILDIDHPLLETYREVMKGYSAATKIATIKLLREKVPGLGLADAKYIVEASPSDVEAHVHRTGALHSFPRPSTGW